ncbi:MAG: methyltransferase domain-containing protein [Haloarculaceae archaeon]
MTDTPGDGAETENAWEADRYDGDHSFVYEYGADLLGLLKPEPGERVLDVGCGTGHLTAEISERGAEVVGLDRSAGMLAEARDAHPECRFVRGDARQLPVRGPFDAAFSNATLHWIPGDDHGAVLASVRDALAPGGRFVAEFGGTGNVATIVDAVRAEAAERGYETDHRWYFPSVGEYAPRLEERGFEVRYARLFDRPTELEGGEGGLASWLEMFGDDLLAPVPDEELDAVVAGVEDRLRDELFRAAEGTWVADYRRLRFVAVRTS